MRRPLSLLTAALTVTGSLAFSTSGQALPLGAMPDLAKSVPASTEQVQWRGGWGGGPGWRGGGWGGGWRGGWGGPGWGGGWRGGWAGPGWGGGGWGYRAGWGPGWGYRPGWGGCGWGNCGWGWGAPAAGFATGVIVGSAMAAPPVYAAPVYGGNAVAYCMRRFRSYDPRSGTYLGYDGLRHPCP